MRMAAAASVARAAAGRVVLPALPSLASMGHSLRPTSSPFGFAVRSMVSATSPSMAKKGKKDAAAPKKVRPPSRSDEASTTSVRSEPKRFARGTGRRRTAAERAAAAASTAAQAIRNAESGTDASAGPLPGAAGTVAEVDRFSKMLSGAIDGIDGIDGDAYSAHDRILEAGGGEDPHEVAERAKASASRLMDQTSTGPVRVRGPEAMRAQVERQAVFTEAKATRNFYRDHEIGGDDDERWRGQGSSFSGGIVNRAEGRDFGFHEDDFDGPKGQRMAAVMGEDLRMWATDGESGDDSIRGPFGTAPLAAVPPAAVEELASPIKYVFPDDSDAGDAAASQPTLRKDYSKGSFGIVDPRLSPSEQALDAERRALRAKFLDPLPVPTQPIHQQYIYLANNRQHHKIVRGGMETTEKAMAIVGNGCGGIGFGMARHAQADRATELAIAAAQRDMIHVSLYKGQLYHDLVGRKNNIKVIIWSKSPGHERPSGDAMITTIMELMGVKHFSAKIVGPKRRNPFTVAQALFSAFDNHLPAEAAASNRGLRLLRLGADRFRPRQAYPMSAKGPSFAASSSYRNRTNQ